MIKVSVLNENTAGIRGLLAEHGLSLLLETEGKRYLFDTGQTDVFMKNAAVMGKELTGLDGIILSHGHFDHCDGLEYLVRSYREKNSSMPPIYVREGAFLHKTAINRPKLTYRNIGISWKREIVDSALCLTADMQKISDHVWVLGNIPYTVEFEGRPDTFFIDKDGEKTPDYMEDEQMLVIETDEGLCVFAGCCHAGIINCLSYVKQKFPGKRLRTVFAGMHLMNAGRERIRRTAEALKTMDIALLIPVHCTGLEAIGRLKNEFEEKCLLVQTGKTIEL